jgi:hypothetical protein
MLYDVATWADTSNQAINNLGQLRRSYSNLGKIYCILYNKICGCGACGCAYRILPEISRLPTSSDLLLRRAKSGSVRNHQNRLSSPSSERCFYRDELPTFHFRLFFSPIQFCALPRTMILFDFQPWHPRRIRSSCRGG